MKHPEEWTSGDENASVWPENQHLRVHSHNWVRPEHCYNDHFHHVYWWDWATNSWKEGGFHLCAVWRFGDQDWNPERHYNCDQIWNVTAGWWWTGEGDHFAASNQFSAKAGLGGHYDFDRAMAPECFLYRGGNDWSANGC